MSDVGVGCLDRCSLACAGIVYGLYLTLSSWVLFHVATAMTFFPDKCHLADLNTTPTVLESYCASVSTLGNPFATHAWRPWSQVQQQS